MKTHCGRALFVTFLALLVGCAVNPVTGKRELALISRDQEIALGRESGPKFETEFEGKVANPELQTYVAAVGSRVAAVSDRPMPYEFALLNSDIPNAFALPGGKVYITRGLFKIMTNERQLAAVLGHEVGHVSAKHISQMLNRQLGAAILIEVAGGGEATAGQVAQVVANMVDLSFSRDQEYQADQLGIKYMAKAGYNPHGMVELLTHLQSLSQSEPGRLTEMFQTHPLTSKRIAEAAGIVKTGYPSADAAKGDPNAKRFLDMRTILK